MTPNTIQLTGTSWNHTRGHLPMVATAQRFNEIHPEFEITWERRSLQEFADAPLDELASKFDLLIMDHPWMGTVAEEDILLPLENCVSDEFLKDQSTHSVGASYQSYTYDGHQWAVSVDAATPVASSRTDLMEKHGISLPETYEEVITLAEEGMVALAAIPLNCLMEFYMFCSACGEEPFQSDDQVVTTSVGIEALREQRRLFGTVDPECFEWDPISVYEHMTKTDEYVYCPFAYGYANYARRGYARKTLSFHDLVTFRDVGKFRSTLGGAGLAVSRDCQHPEVAGEYVEFVASEECQRTLYFESGGQPGHKRAWTDERVNDISNGFFKNTLAAHTRAYLRPRYDGYLYFQENAGRPIQTYLKNGGEEERVLNTLNELYTESLQEQST